MEKKPKIFEDIDEEELLGVDKKPGRLKKMVFIATAVFLALLEIGRAHV